MSHKCNTESVECCDFEVIERIIIVVSLKASVEQRHFGDEDASIRHQWQCSQRSKWRDGVCKLGVHQEIWSRKNILCSLCLKERLSGLMASLPAVHMSPLPLRSTFCAHRYEKVSYCHGQPDHNSNNCDLKVGQ